MTRNQEIVAAPQTFKSTRSQEEILDYQDRMLKQKLAGVINSDRTYSEILEYIENEIKESTRDISFSYKVECFVEDGAYALSRAVEEINGFTTQRGTGPSGTNPPRMLDVRFADGERKKVPFGKIELPNLGDNAHINMHYSADTHNLTIDGTCQKRFQGMLDKIVERTRVLVNTESIYKGKAIKIVDDKSSPTFIDLSNIVDKPLFLTAEAKYNTLPIEARIERSEDCIKSGVDLRYGVLLEGQYGTGKTLYAFKLAYKAILNGWSFIYCPDASKMKYIMDIANTFSNNGRGIVLFIEDVDRVLNSRDNMTNEISLLMDGGESKNKNVITILTTNHIENIDPTFLRGKRIGSIVTLTHLDFKAAKNMIESFLVNEDGMSIIEDDCDDAAKLMESYQIVPAFIAEILEKVKAHLIFSGKDTISCEDIVSSINSFKRQMDIATLKKNQESDNDGFVRLFKTVMGSNPVDYNLIKDYVTDAVKEAL